jgi:hypothetical protein
MRVRPSVIVAEAITGALGRFIRGRSPTVTGGSPDAEKRGLLPGPLGGSRWEREIPITQQL